jgi:hypothetical protein
LPACLCAACRVVHARVPERTSESCRSRWPGAKGNHHPTHPATTLSVRRCRERCRGGMASAVGWLPRAGTHPRSPSLARTSRAEVPARRRRRRSSAHRHHTGRQLGRCRSAAVYSPVVWWCVLA